jgi:hypothetical protein
MSRYAHSRILAAVIVLAVVSQVVLAATGNLSDRLRSELEALRAGSADYSQMEPMLADQVEKSREAIRAALRQVGAIQSVEYRGMQSLPMGQAEAYRVKFERGEMMWLIAVSSAGKLQTLWSPGPG